MSRALIVNALGEVFLDGQLIAGSVNINTLERKLGRKHTDADVDAAFSEMLRDGSFTDDEIATVEVVWQAQKTLPYRVQRYKNAIRVSEEFCFFVDDADMAARIYAAAGRIGADIDVMWDTPHSDHWWKTNRKGERIEEHIGPDHGRMERQIDVSIRCDCNLDDIRAKGELMQEAMGPVFSTNGVTII